MRGWADACRGIQVHRDCERGHMKIHRNYVFEQ
nr:MAG TPA: hypothetical protein [Caudoviricetes sp.]